MLLKRFYDTKLAQASYLLGCQVTGDAIVVDPNRDVDQYIAAAAEEGLHIAHVTETHIHADFVSGSRELAERTGAQLYLSDEGGDEWRYRFVAEAHAKLLHDGDVINVGRVKLDVLHTPGHTPEHLTFLVTDTATTNRPMGALTGDFIFVGDVGRPDLLERAANMAGTMELSARALFSSVARFKQHMDYLQLWPGHGAGSACGKSLGAVPSTTLGYERIANWALAEDDQETFVSTVLAGQPEAPKYFAHMKRINRDGPRVLGEFPKPVKRPAPELSKLLENGALVIDTRSAGLFASRHVPGTINIPYNRSFSTWAGSIIPFDADFYLIADDTDPAVVEEMLRDLVMIGLDRVVGYFDTSAIDAWRVQQGRELEGTPQMSARVLADRLQEGGVHVLDVRGAAEWEAGHLPGVPNIPLGQLSDRVSELPSDTPIVVHCQGGSRSAIAASILRAKGFSDVTNLSGGYGEWAREKLKTEK